jgi:hypothetical protein
MNTANNPDKPETFSESLDVSNGPFITKVAKQIKKTRIGEWIWRTIVITLLGTSFVTGMHNTHSIDSMQTDVTAIHQEYKEQAKTLHYIQDMNSYTNGLLHTHAEHTDEETYNPPPLPQPVAPYTGITPTPSVEPGTTPISSPTPTL